MTLSLRTTACLAAALLASACARRPEAVPPPPSRLDFALEQLRGTDPASRKSARASVEQLARAGLAPDEAARLVRAAAGLAPGDADRDENAAALLRAASTNPSVELVAPVLDEFARLPVGARGEAFALLAAIPSPAASAAWMRLLADNSAALTRLEAGALLHAPRDPEIFFPELLAYLEDLDLAPDVYELCVAFEREGLLTPERLAPAAPQLLALFESLDRRLAPAQPRDGLAWVNEEDYLEPRYQMELLLDVLGYLPPASVGAALRHALAYRDPRLKYFALASLVRQDQPVAPGAIEEIAACAEMRLWLFDLLRSSGRAAQFPAGFAQQAALAESDMVGWLAYPTQLGQAPDEIELMSVVTRPDERGEQLDYYVFRFRTFPPHWTAENGWLSGVSGPFRRSEQPSTSALGATGSAYEKWGALTPSELVDAQLGLAQRTEPARTSPRHATTAQPDGQR